MYCIQSKISVYGLAQGNVPFPNVTFSIKDHMFQIKIKSKIITNTISWPQVKLNVKQATELSTKKLNDLNTKISNFTISSKM